MIHSCDLKDKAGCEQVCTKKDDLAVCGCNDGFKVSTTDPKKCEKSKLIIAKLCIIRDFCMGVEIILRWHYEEGIVLWYYEIVQYVTPHLQHSLNQSLILWR